jgi:hypothetical protein
MMSSKYLLVTMFGSINEDISSLQEAFAISVLEPMLL